MISDLNNYTDSLHYGEWINSDILNWMSTGEGELNRDNYLLYFEELREIYQQFDYSAYFD
jgi:hypothetical protein